MNPEQKDYLVSHLESQPSSDWITNLANAWLEAEDMPFAMGVLATVDTQGRPHSRTVALREMNADDVLFFTQAGSQKVAQIQAEPWVSLTLMLPQTSRQIIFEGGVVALSDQENTSYWAQYDIARRLRFMVYGPRSGQNLTSAKALDQELEALQSTYQESAPQRPAAYVGFRIVPTCIRLYQMNDHRLSDSVHLSKHNHQWQAQRLVP